MPQMMCIWGGKGWFIPALGFVGANAVRSGVVGLPAQVHTEAVIRRQKKIAQRPQPNGPPRQDGNQTL